MNNLSKHAEIFQPEMLLDTPVHVIGCGATGANIALQLTKLGVPEIHIYDMDVIEEHNIANQIFRVNQIGKRKVDALKEILAAHSPYEGTVIYEHYQEVNRDYIAKNPLSGIVFVATDTMKSRKEIYDAAGIGNINIKRWIEMRLDLSFIRLYSIRPANYKEHLEYVNSLYDQDEVLSVSACGISQTAFPTASFLASISVWEMLNYLNDNNDYNEIMIDLANWNSIKRKFD